MGISYRSSPKQRVLPLYRSLESSGAQGNRRQKETNETGCDEAEREKGRGQGRGARRGTDLQGLMTCGIKQPGGKNGG